MLYKFKSRAAPDLIMLEPNGRRVLELIGKAPGSKGIIEPDQMPQAIAALEAAIAAEAAERAAQGAQHGTSGDEADADKARGEPITLRQRAIPFINMLQRCQLADEEIVWGV